jgi:hypothetical protein
MNRLSRFTRNAGWRGTLRSILVAAIFIFFLFFSRSGQVEIAIAAPLALAGFFLVYPFRGLLLLNLAVSRLVLGVSAIAIVGSALVLGKVMKDLPKQEPWIVTALVAFAGVYMGAYFWLHSDPRIERTED